MLVFVIPAFNEEATIGTVVLDAKQYGKVLVVNDGSTDNTKYLASECGAAVISLDVNSGYDHALKVGIQKAWSLNPSAILTIDADGELSPHDGMLLLEESVREKTPLAVGVRPEIERVGEKLVTAYTAWRYGIEDVLCGMKLYHPGMIPSAFVRFAGDNVGMRLPIELSKAGFSISQKPIGIRKRSDRPRFGNSFTANLKIIRKAII